MLSLSTRTLLTVSASPSTRDSMSSSEIYGRRGPRKAYVGIPASLNNLRVSIRSWVGDAPGSNTLRTSSLQDVMVRPTSASSISLITSKSLCTRELLVRISTGNRWSLSISSRLRVALNFLSTG